MSDILLKGNDRYSLPAIHQPGGIYCAPWCGCDCTHAEYARAVKEADALATFLGDGWMPDVWENMGWHYRARKGAAHVSPNVKRTAIRHEWVIYSYTAFFNSAHQVVASADTPDDALGFAVQDARTIERRISEDLRALLS